MSRRQRRSAGRRDPWWARHGTWLVGSLIVMALLALVQWLKP
jgi:hypothetical protein